MLATISRRTGPRTPIAKTQRAPVELEYDPAGHDVHAEASAGVDAKDHVILGAGLRKSIRSDL